jgi:hypothetical protein
MVRFVLKRVAFLVCVATIGCGGAASAPGAPAVAPAGQRAFSGTSQGNIYWNKMGLRLPYPAKRPSNAVLTFWAPDGYFTEPLYCKNGGNITATPGRKWGNPSAYEHVVFHFQAMSPGPDACGFTAVLNNTGSPPFAVIKLHIER